MRSIFNTNFNTNTLHFWLLIFRIAAGTFLLTHGLPKFQKFSAGGDIQFADPFGLGPTTSLALVIFAEFICSILVILGLATRLATIPIIITMLVAAFSAHIADPFAKKELSLLYLLIFITLTIFGPGKFSVDGVVSNRRKL